ncbi:hypothetical protein D6D13_00454 [Aureobasidium pullulans]|uniref:Uncharacterized protein n=1 Tax=Aureobasidium pullulans TaxID=5580 RepID=A0A4S9DC92_AURPU|nr:hypothetical protein D6D13_00454 [Aureobasidium pullulans]
MLLSTTIPIIWRDEINAAIEMLNDRDAEGCINALHTLLLNPRVPDYWRIRAYVLCGKATNDWYEAENYQYAAELLWAVSRRLWPAGYDEDFDQTLHTNRTFLDEFAVDLDAEMPDELREFRKNAEKKEQEQAAAMSEENDSTDEEWDESANPSDEGEVEMQDFGQDSPPGDVSPYDPEAVMIEAAGDETWEEVKGGSDEE